MPRDRSLRCSDRDREAVGAILREAHIAGRLDADEFAERFGRALEARTYAELDSLMVDLPVGDDEVTSVVGPTSHPATTWGDPTWPPPGWGQPEHQLPGQPAGPIGSPSLRRLHHLPPWGVFFLAWLALAFAVFAATSGHVFWLFFPLAWFFWPRGGKRRWRGPFW